MLRWECDAAAYAAILLYAFAAILSRAQALDTQLEQRGLGAGSAAEALHVLERVASLENELTLCEQQVHHRALCAESIYRSNASFMQHTPMQKGIQKIEVHGATLGKYRTVTVRTHRSTAVIGTHSVCS